MELDACIGGRRSVRSYRDTAVPKNIIDKILKSGTLAPSAMNAQPWRFVVIEDKSTIMRLSRRVKEILLNMPWPDHYKKAFQSEEDTIFYGAPLIILIFVPKGEETRTRDFNMLDCGLAAQNMFLTAYQEGLGSCFIGLATFLSLDPEVLTDAGIPKGYELISPLIFGYPAESPSPKPRDVKILKWIE
jgi:nitroreductase